MTPDDLVQIEQIRRLKYRYCRLLDTKRFDEIGPLFLPDATAAYGGGATQLRGPDAIVGYLRGAMSSTSLHSSHVAGHPEIDLVGSDEATGSWVLTDLVILDDVGMTVRGASYYDDRYRRVHGEWRFVHTGYRRLYEELGPRGDRTRLTASWWSTDGRSSLT